jgi:hypothetical protein
MHYAIMVSIHNAIMVSIHNYRQRSDRIRSKTTLPFFLHFRISSYHLIGFFLSKLSVIPRILLNSISHTSSMFIGTCEFSVLQIGHFIMRPLGLKHVAHHRQLSEFEYDIRKSLSCNLLLFCIDIFVGYD